MKIKFIVGFIVGFITPAVILFLFLNSIINRENLNFVSKYEFIDAAAIKEKHKNAIVCVLSTGCPGKIETIPILISNIEKFKNRNIDYVIIADEIYNNRTDRELDSLEVEFNFKEKIYLLNKNIYTKNGGIIYAKKRYKTFINDLCGTEHNCLFGYVNYTLMKDGKCINNTFDLLDEDLMIY